MGMIEKSSIPVDKTNHNDFNLSPAFNKIGFIFFSLYYYYYYFFFLKD